MSSNNAAVYDVHAYARLSTSPTICQCRKLRPGRSGRAAPPDTSRCYPLLPVIAPYLPCLVRLPLVPLASTSPTLHRPLFTLLSCLPLISRRLLIFPRGQKDNGKHVSIFLDAPETQFKSPSQVWNAVCVRTSTSVRYEMWKRSGKDTGCGGLTGAALTRTRISALEDEFPLPQDTLYLTIPPRSWSQKPNSTSAWSTNALGRFSLRVGLLFRGRLWGARGGRNVYTLYVSSPHVHTLHTFRCRACLYQGCP